MMETPDDLCECCRVKVASIECAHGLLCEECAKEVHDENGQCQFE